LRELSLHLLDIAENSIAADARTIRICVSEDTRKDLLKMSVKDDGKGMDAETAASVIDPFVTSRTTRKVGLGIPLLKEAAELCNGSLSIVSEKGKGTLLEVSFQRSHIDRMPLGDLATTILHLVVTNPGVHWIFEYTFDDRKFEFDDAPIKQELDGMSMTEPSVLSVIREMLETGVKDAQMG
jgi:anti-sigma regulatory factor (Ser/Thr protein kinase)